MCSVHCPSGVCWCDFVDLTWNVSKFEAANFFRISLQFQYFRPSGSATFANCNSNYKITAAVVVIPLSQMMVSLVMMEVFTYLCQHGWADKEWWPAEWKIIFSIREMRFIQRSSTSKIRAFNALWYVLFIKYVKMRFQILLVGSEKKIGWELGFCLKYNWELGFEPPPPSRPSINKVSLGFLL